MNGTFYPQPYRISLCDVNVYTTKKKLKVACDKDTIH